MSMIDRAKRKIVRDDLGLGTTTSLEDTAALVFHNAHIARPACQYKVGNYRLDFAWPDADPPVAVEVDGPHHYAPEAAATDVMRDRWLRDQGWVVLRINHDASDEAWVALCRALHSLAGGNRG
jgi:very-short-patch-repair endonuclease